ncbi:MAG: FeoA domain-containing protein [Candidatus Omnitrophica bacterium]|nr:FeoA domain-containing protein [Candidatus Omnitrophota bacterium]
MDRELEDIMLEIWKRREQKKSSISGLDPSKLNLLKEKGLVTISAGTVSFTPQGEEIAKILVRRHRLWEVFFHDVLGMKEFNEMAGAFEHEASGNIDQALCDFLDHPQQCPDGRPIPRGQCCKRKRKRAGWGFFQNMGIMRLCDVPKGKKVRIVCLRGKLFPKLSGYGIVPGSIVSVQETFSGFIIRIDHSEVALDRESCADILVQIIPDEDET